MTKVEESAVTALIQAYRGDGDRAARDQLLVELLPVVRALASRYAGRGEPFDDLVQVGSIGLIKAIDRFEPDRGVRFTSYAIPTIVGEIRRHFRDKTWALHVPRSIKELSVRLSRVVDSLALELGRAPTVAELAEATGASDEDVIDALESATAYSTRSLESPFDGTETLAETLGSSDEGYQLVDDTSVISQGLGALDNRSRRIVEMRFFDEMTQSQIAAELGISQMHVSRLLRRALDDMRGQLGELEALA